MDEITSPASGASDHEAKMRERYGLHARKRGIHRQPWFPAALLFAISGGAWLLWSASHYSLPEIRQTVISFKAIDSRHIELRYSVTFKSRNKAHICQLVAKDFDTNVVGETSDIFPAGTRSNTLVTVIPTRVEAVNASISRCAVK